MIFSLIILGEALGAIGDASVIPVLEEYSKDPVSEVAETCELALNRLQWLKLNGTSINLEKSPYMSVDPAPPAEIDDVDKLRDILLDENVPLFERYRAMFSLRNMRTSKSILALGEGKYINKKHYGVNTITANSFLLKVHYSFIKITRSLFDR